VQLVALGEHAHEPGAGGLGLVHGGGVGEAGDVHAGGGRLGARGDHEEQAGEEEGNEREASHQEPHRRSAAGS
jgi:hypothetical protein